MADQKVTDLTAITTPTTDDLLYLVDDPSGTPLDRKLALLDLLNTLVGPQPPCARLTTESGIPVSTSDRTSQGTIYWTPYNGSRIWLYTSSKWTPYLLTEISLALTLTSGKNYDVFVYDNSGTVTLELSAAWTNDTTRADAITTQSGMYVKSGATNKLLVGTIRASGTNVTEDSLAKRFVWNQFNQVPRKMKVAEATDSWNYTTATYRQANANAANQLDYVVGNSNAYVTAHARCMAFNATGVGVAIGIGVDSTSTNSADYYGFNASSQPNEITADYGGYPGLGRHILTWLEYSNAAGTTTWYGDAGNPTLYQNGITGIVWN